MSRASALNPFRFGVVVDGPFFTDRTTEKAELKQALNSANHIVLISPRRYGKSSLALNVARSTKRPLIYMNLQSATSVTDFANQLLKEVLKAYKFENIRRHLAGLRGSPAFETDMATGAISVYFRPIGKESTSSLEDVFTLIEKLATAKKRPIVILDEFQEAASIDAQLFKKLRSVMQMQQNINYVFIGSEESMMEQIFNSKKSPFYHFGLLMRLARIPKSDFESFVAGGLQDISKHAALIARDIVAFTESHPYYTQLLSYKCFEFLRNTDYDVDTLPLVCSSIVAEQDNNYEKLWNQLNKNQQGILVSLALGAANIQPAKNSTYYSSLKALVKKGLVVKLESYILEDPFFKLWIEKSRR
ncbi:MAG: AAA family ATPase [Coriobacteriales bacterium]|jgi:AAA+ ATPase superfamily predicted ATPase|nr:AAA family ATPase [Coriobacteriales bacterium]